MKTIKVKFLPCTNRRPARYKAECDGNSLVLSCSGLKAKDNGSLMAAEKLAIKLGWAPCTLSEGRLDSRTAIFVVDAMPYAVPKQPIYKIFKFELWGNLKDGMDSNNQFAIGRTDYAGGAEDPEAYARSIFSIALPRTESGNSVHLCHGKCLDFRWSDEKYADIFCKKYDQIVGSIKQTSLPVSGVDKLIADNHHGPLTKEDAEWYAIKNAIDSIPE